MKKLTTTIVTLLAASAVIGILSACTTNGSIQDSTTAEMMQVSRLETPRGEDLYTLYTELPRRHKDFFHASDMAEFRDEYAHALIDIDSLIDIDFYFTLRRLAAYARDSHTSVGFTQALASQLHCIPAQVQYLDGAWRLSVVNADRRELLGAEVLTIQGRPIEEIISAATPLFSHDNETWLQRAIGQQLNLTELYVYLGLSETSTDSVLLTLAVPGIDGETTITLEPVTVGAFRELELATIYDNLPPTGMSNQPYRFMELDGGHTVFVQYNVCASYEAYPLKTFIGEVLATIDVQDPEHVIIDLRYNGGGDSSLFEPMVDALATRQKAKGFQLDVLIGEGTFSSALMNAMHFKERTEARLVGSPSGGSVNHYGEIKSFTLPHSGIPVTYSTKFFTMDADHAGDSLQPDLYVQPKVADMLAGIDTTVEAIL